MINKPGLYLFAALILLAVISIKMDSPPYVVDENAPDSVFSAARAYKYLLEICKAPHSTGTPENKRVREYIVDQCQAMGLQTHIQNTTAIRKSETWVNAANVYNVIARLKGQSNEKSLVVMAHYDTQPNAPGAGDDGAGVAAMLETARILTATKTIPKNDIVFFFTDAEESGLSGAQGFVQDTTLTKEVGLALNFEGRGSSGVSTMFEVNSENGWAVAHYIEAAKNPSGNSLGYEIYKTLPNDTDYTIFREAGISGLNNAFIGDFVNYHSPNDRPENLDLRSLQHHGANMLSLVKHFGNISLVQTKAADISFFSVFGRYMMSYPTVWNLPFMIFCGVQLLVFLVVGIRKKKITLTGLIAGFFAFTGLLVIMALSTFVLIRGIEAIYPLYKNFYASNSYNSYYYFFAFTSLSVVLFSLLYRWLLVKFSLTSLLAGIFLFHFTVLVLMYLYMSTAIFIILFPLIFTLVGNIILLYHAYMEKPIVIVLLVIVFLPAVVLLAPAIKQMYEAFGLSPPVGAASVLVGLMLSLFLPVFDRVFTESKYVIPGLALISFVAALVLAHANSLFTEQEPLQSNVQYQLNVDENEAHWISRFTETDPWNKQFFPNTRAENGRLTSDAPLLPFNAPTAVVKKDTVENGVRRLYVHCHSTRYAFSIHIGIDGKNPASEITVTGPAGGNGNKKMNGRYKEVFYTGLDSAGLDVVFETNPGVPFEFTVADSSIGLPSIAGFSGYPDNIIPGVGWNANTVYVLKRFVF